MKRSSFLVTRSLLAAVAVALLVSAGGCATQSGTNGPHPAPPGQTDGKDTNGPHPKPQRRVESKDTNGPHPAS